VVGHSRLLAARKLVELLEVPVHIAADLTEAQCRAYLDPCLLCCDFAGPIRLPIAPIVHAHRRRPPERREHAERSKRQCEPDLFEGLGIELPLRIALPGAAAGGSTSAIAQISNVIRVRHLPSLFSTTN